MKIRILAATPFAGVTLPCDCVPDLADAAAAELVALGAADDNAAAVAYAETLGVPVPELPAEMLPTAAPAKKRG